MALGKRREVAQPLFVATAHLAGVRPNPFYQSVNKVLAAHHFDAFVEPLCARFYDDKKGRPGLAPGIYFRCLLVGYFEGLGSERGIAWRCADSKSLGLFLGYAFDEQTPDHSTLSRTRRLIDIETHQEVFAYVLKILANHDLIEGKTIGVDSTTLEANAALRSIVRRDSGQGYQDFLTELAKQSGGIGLISMQERLKLLKGTLSIESQPKRGTRVHARVPLASGNGSMQAEA